MYIYTCIYMFIHMYIYVHTSGFELSILQSHIAIYFSIINMPKKNHFTIFVIQNFVQNTQKTHVNSVYIVGIMFYGK